MAQQTLCVVCIDTGEVGLNQCFGKFTGISHPGLNCVMWPFQTVTNVSTKVQSLDVETATKTKDNVPVTVRSSIQIAVDPSRADQYWFKLSNPHQQVSAHVHDTIRSALPALTLDEAFESKERMAGEIKDTVNRSMEQYGLVVHKALVTDMAADPVVLRAMNEINAARRHRVAATDKSDHPHTAKPTAMLIANGRHVERVDRPRGQGLGFGVWGSEKVAGGQGAKTVLGDAVEAWQAEAEKNMAVKSAEAAAAAQELSGKGTARMREAISEGFRGSIESMKESTGMHPQEVIHMILETQYLDVLKDFASSGRATMVLPHSASPHDIELQVRKGFDEAATRSLKMK